VIALAAITDPSFTWEKLAAAGANLKFSQHPDWVTVDNWTVGAGEITAQLDAGMHEIVVTGAPPPNDSTVLAAVLRVVG